MSDRRTGSALRPVTFVLLWHWCSSLLGWLELFHVVTLKWNPPQIAPDCCRLCLLLVSMFHMLRELQWQERLALWSKTSPFLPCWWIYFDSYDILSLCILCGILHTPCCGHSFNHLVMSRSINVISVLWDTQRNMPHGIDRQKCREQGKGTLYFGHHCPNPSSSSLSLPSAGRPHSRGAAGVGEYPPAQAGAAGGHSG